MNLARCSLLAEPRGRSYQELLEAAARMCATGTLITHLGKPYLATANDVIEALRDDELSAQPVGNWPGTQLANGFSATRHDFRLTEHALGLLLDRARGLYDWHMPDLPDDLSFSRGDGSLWLGSTGHEGDSFIEMSNDELDAVRREFPAFAALIGRTC